MTTAGAAPSRTARAARDATLVLALALAYYVLARLGLRLAFVQANASPVWAPAGLALAALLAGGLRLWPGILLGAFLANLMTPGTPISTAFLVAAGNTIAAAGAAIALRRLGFDPALRRFRDVLVFLEAGVLLAPVVSATNGTLQLVASGTAQAGTWRDIWLVWYSGDAVGTLLVAPFLLAWWTRRRRTGYLAASPEAFALFAGVALCSWLVFWQDVSGSSLGPSLAFVVFPFGAWGALRFGVRGATLVSFLIGLGSVLGTILRGGPFAVAGLHHQLFQFQLFVITLAASSLLLAGLSEERVHAEKELASAKERAEEADRLKSALLASMSHELRTPLNSIIGFTTLLQKELVGPLNPEQRKQLGWVKSSSVHLLELVNGVLDISRIEAGQLEVRPAPFDPAASLRKCVEQVSPAATAKGLALFLEVAPGVGTFESDPRRFEQVVLNLLGNAVKFTESGGITVRCAVEAESLVTSIADTGIGIAPEDGERLFRPFRQVDSGLSRRYEGMGLGLAICRGLLALLGGEIAFESEPGRGSVFTFRLPLRQGGTE
jgi:signal transduction histidine kinase